MIPIFPGTLKSIGPLVPDDEEDVMVIRKGPEMIDVPVSLACAVIATDPTLRAAFTSNVDPLIVNRLVPAVSENVYGLVEPFTTEKSPITVPMLDPEFTVAFESVSAAEPSETPIPRRLSPPHGNWDVVGVSETPTDGIVTPMPTS